jgi:hypothetical protein
MNYEQVQFIDQTVRQVHHALGNMLITTGLAVQRGGVLSPENQALFLQQWQRLHLQAIQEMQASLTALSLVTNQQFGA